MMCSSTLKSQINTLLSLFRHTRARLTGHARTADRHSLNHHETLMQDLQPQRSKDEGISGAHLALPDGWLKVPSWP